MGDNSIIFNYITRKDRNFITRKDTCLKSLLNCTKEIQPENHARAKNYVINSSLEQFKLKKSYSTSKTCKKMCNQWNLYPQFNKLRK